MTMKQMVESTQKQRNTGTLANSIELIPLEDQIMELYTTNRKIGKVYTNKKIKLLVGRKNREENKIHALEIQHGEPCG